MSAPDQILQLIELFEKNKDTYKSSQYNESSTRQEFLDPFFTALGWDVGNRNRLSEAEKEVRIEVNINVGEARKAPDYCFYKNGEMQFFVEAKKPSVNLLIGGTLPFRCAAMRGLLARLLSVS